jgi:DNA end-binding protein Ku
VLVEDADLEAIMQIDDSKAIEITRFVDAAEVDPVYFDRTYYLAPASEPAARRPYVLLLRAMQDSGKAALGRFVRQGAEHLCLIRPKGESLALETMFLAEDVNSQAEIEEAVGESDVKKAELALAQQVIESLVGEFDPKELTSEYRQNLRQMLEAKLTGQEVTRPEPVPETPVVDLMEALKRSVEEVKDGKSAGKKAAAKDGSGSRKRVAARKSA